MSFFLDNMVSPRIVGALKELGEDVEALRERFAPNCPDSVWIEALGNSGGILITVDNRIVSRPPERMMLKQANITSFFLRNFFVKMKFWDQATWLIRNWPRIEATAGDFTRGAAFTVQQNGKMSSLSV